MSDYFDDDYLDEEQGRDEMDIYMQNGILRALLGEAQVLIDIILENEEMEEHPYSEDLKGLVFEIDRFYYRFRE